MTCGPCEFDEVEKTKKRGERTKKEKGGLGKETIACCGRVRKQKTTYISLCVNQLVPLAKKQNVHDSPFPCDPLVVSKQFPISATIIEYTRNI